MGILSPKPFWGYEVFWSAWDKGESPLEHDSQKDYNINRR